MLSLTVMPERLPWPQIQKLIEPSKTALEKLSKEMQDLQTKLQNSKIETEQGAD